MKTPGDLRRIDLSIAKATEKLQRLTKQRGALVGLTSLVCRHCISECAISALVYIQTHWYVRPSGCSDGDYFTPGEGQWDCPACGHNNRLYNNPEIEALKHLFSRTIQCYCDQDHSICSDPRPCATCKAEGRDRDGRRAA